MGTGHTDPESMESQNTAHTESNPSTFEETEVPREFFCENCQLTHPPPNCPCPICNQVGHLAVECPHAKDLESAGLDEIHQPNRSGNDVLLAHCTIKGNGLVKCEVIHLT